MSRPASGFRRIRGGRIISDLSAHEAQVLSQLVDQLPAVLASGRSDPAVQRLLPDAYRGDEEAAAEFRTYTEQGLIDGKLEGARTLQAFLASERTELSDAEARVCVRTLTDLRLVLASRLGIRHDGDRGDLATGLAGVYEWLGYLQESLVRALDR